MKPNLTRNERVPNHTCPRLARIHPTYLSSSSGSGRTTFLLPASRRDFALLFRDRGNR